MGVTESVGGDGGAAGRGWAPVAACRSDDPQAHPTATASRARPGRWPLISLGDLRDITLQWSTGLLAALMGAEMLIVPHQPFSDQSSPTSWRSTRRAASF